MKFSSPTPNIGCWPRDIVEVWLVRGKKELVCKLCGGGGGGGGVGFNEMNDDFYFKLFLHLIRGDETQLICENVLFTSL